MKEKMIVIAFFFALLFVFAKLGPAINFSVTSQEKGEPFVVSGEGKVWVTPDIAKITVGVEESGSSLSAVQESVNTKSQSLTEAIKGMDIEKEDIKTTSYNLYPEYDYSSSIRRITGYRVSVAYEITIRDFDKINELITTATSTGANMEGEVSFELNYDSQKEKLDEARKMAVDDAKSKAQGLASAAGITLGSIINISENQTGGGIVPVYANDALKLEGAVGMTSPSIETGQTEIEVTVNLSYEVR